MSIANLSSALAQKLVSHSPAILTALGAAGVIGTALLTGKAYVQADREIQTEDERRDRRGEALMTPKEKVELTWRYFVPPLFAATGTLLCVISAQSINSRRSAAMISLYTMTERARTEFQDKAREVLSDEDYERINEEIAQERLATNAGGTQFLGDTPFEMKNDGVGWCHDIYSDRYFISSQGEIDDAVNRINHELTHNMYADLNMFYSFIGLNEVPYGDKVGWTSDHLLEVQYSYGPAQDGSPCMAVTFKRDPASHFSSFHR